MRNPFLVAIFLITAMALKVSGAPLCTRIFLPPPSAQQISSLLDDLARLTLETDLEKVAGIKDSFLQTEFKNKNQEIKQILDISQAAVSKELRPRLVKLQKEQKNLRSEEIRVRSEQREMGPSFPQFELKQTASIPWFNRFVGLSDQIQGRRRFLVTRWQNNKEYSDLIAFDPTTGTMETVATRFSVAGIDSKNNQIVTFTGNNQNTPGKLQFYSLTNLQVSAPSLALPWAESLILGASRLPRRIDISMDGDHFLVASDAGLYLSLLQKPDEVTESRQGSPIQDILFLKDSNEFLSIHQTHVVLNRSVAQPRHLNLPTGGQMLRLIPADENLTIAVSSTDIMFIRNNEWKVDRVIPHKMKNMVYFEENLQHYVVGVENGKAVLKDLDNYTDSSLFDFSIIPEDVVAQFVHLSNDGKGLVVQGSLNKQTQLWFFENRRTAP